MGGKTPASEWMQFVAKTGVGTAIAFYLIYQGTATFGATLSTIRDDLRSHISETNFYLRAICVNTAKDDGQRASCYPVGGR